MKSGWLSESEGHESLFGALRRDKLITILNKVIARFCQAVRKQGFNSFAIGYITLLANFMPICF
jgi:hypothetical protein